MWNIKGITYEDEGDDRQKSSSLASTSDDDGADCRTEYELELAVHTGRN